MSREAADPRWHPACAPEAVSSTRSRPGPSREVALGELLHRLAERGSALAEARVGEARAELARDLTAQLRRLGVYAAAALLVVFGLQFLVVAAVLGLATMLGGWLASLVVSVASLLAGAAVLLAARSRAGPPFLAKTLGALKEDLRWFTDLLR